MIVIKKSKGSKNYEAFNEHRMTVYIQEMQRGKKLFIYERFPECWKQSDVWTSSEQMIKPEVNFLVPCLEEDIFSDLVTTH